MNQTADIVIAGAGVIGGVSPQVQPQRNGAAGP